jgi:hypothetical protein
MCTFFYKTRYDLNDMDIQDPGSKSGESTRERERAPTMTTAKRIDSVRPYFFTLARLQRYGEPGFRCTQCKICPVMFLMSICMEFAIVPRERDTEDGRLFLSNRD